MLHPMNNLMAVFTIAILLTMSSCNRAASPANPTTTMPTRTLIPSSTRLAQMSTPTTTQPQPTPTQFVTNYSMSTISAGGDHTCALTPVGGVKCWGDNGYGQLGDGTTIPSSKPVDVVGLDSRITAVAAGGYTTCALTTTGGVKCWGLNESGQLGDSTTKNSSTPVDVAGLDSGVVSVSVGGGRACAVTASGGVKCWGGKWYGQLEEGETNYSTTPVDVSGLGSGVAAVSTGNNHICALTTEGGVVCWGFNSFGQLGNGTTKEGSPIPLVVAGLDSGIAAISLGTNHSCALTVSGGVKCWGNNSWGQLGDGTAQERYTPVDVLGLSSAVAAISAGSGQTCALMVSGGIKCWGYNRSGNLGDGSTENRSTPVNVTGLGSGVAAISAGSNHACALMSSGGLKCWGENRIGQLGDGLPPVCVTPVDVMGLSSGVVAISVGSGNACALTSAGGVKCWGAYYTEESTTSERSTVVDMADLTGEVKALSVEGNFYICALTTSGGVKCWTDASQPPVDEAGLKRGMKAITAGVFNMCALTDAGGVKCWGEPEYGGLGDGTTNPSETPVDVVGLSSGVSAVTLGFSHSCAVIASGGVRCWGWNGFGQLGDGTDIDRLTPVNVVGLDSGVMAIAAGSYHTCALLSTGGVKCWGSNEYGQLGDGKSNYDLYSTPVDVVGLTSGVIAITAGENHTCALTVMGGVKCWGDNLFGQLGDGTLTRRTTPVEVVSLGGGVAAIDAGLHYTCALTISGGVKCWGNDSIGQMGDGRILWSSVPVDVAGWP